ncbi:MAG: TonB-dependent receptor plug domain-containing protein, partial [Thalassotalea sp.]|nr:TonB-dependent receptor plug domain-containing protein [Thalassotalea sp.]
MSSFKFQKHVLASSIAMVLAGASASAIAAEENAAANAEENIEVIEVTGIRGSNKKNLNAKKFSNSIVDVVNAEDVGKFPDSDVGEALARVPGVAVNRQFGQGQQVSIRGASNQLTLTTLNGQNVASTGWYDQQAIDRSFNYSLLPPEMVAGLEVYKSSQADLVEGGIGGTVNVITRKPLDMDSGSIFGSVDYNYSSATEDGDPSYSGLYSWKNEDETIGILGAVSIEDTTYGRRGTESLYGWGGSVSENYFEQERERTSIDVTFQYAPTENLEFALHYMNLDLSADNTNTSAFIFQNL